jgi:hypothetical protein
MAVWGYAKTGSGTPWLERHRQPYFSRDCPEVNSRSAFRGQYTWVFRRVLAVLQKV